MKKILLALGLCAAAALMLPSCKKDTDYFSYVSEYRKDVYLYKDDDCELKIYCSDRETPYRSDGVKGETGAVTEIYYKGEKPAKEVEAYLGDTGGEMSYLAVTGNYYLSFSGAAERSASLKLKLSVDGVEREIDVGSVLDAGTIDGRTALKCVREYDGESFERLSAGGGFDGEIYVRLLYDEGCYYYVGLCDREKNVHAYLVDGTDGRIIAERESTAE